MIRVAKGNEPVPFRHAVELMVEAIRETSAPGGVDDVVLYGFTSSAAEPIREVLARTP